MTISSRVLKKIKGWGISPRGFLKKKYTVPTKEFLSTSLFSPGAGDISEHLLTMLFFTAHVISRWKLLSVKKETANFSFVTARESKNTRQYSASH